MTNTVYTGIQDAGLADSSNALLSCTSRIIDFVVLDSTELSSPKELDANVISLDGITMDISGFMELFYKTDTKTFKINGSMSEKDEIHLKKQNIDKSLFKLLDTVFSLYSKDLNIKCSYMDPCSVMKITEQLKKYNTLLDFCVNSSLTFSDILEMIINKSDTSTGTYSDKQEFETIFGSGTNDQYHILVLNIRFHNANPLVKDIILKFNYNVKFNGNTFDILETLQNKGYFTELTL
jgi:hypothetical protein